MKGGDDCLRVNRPPLHARRPEFDLRFKTDASPDGPPPGTPVVINAGMKGDRGFVIFSAPSEIGAFIKTKC